MKVRIGSAYQPIWFERRGSDGSFSALRPLPTIDGELLQKALLDQRYGRAPNPRRTFVVVIVLILIVLLVTK